MLPQFHELIYKDFLMLSVHSTRSVANSKRKKNRQENTHKTWPEPAPITRPRQANPPLSILSRRYGIIKKIKAKSKQGAKTPCLTKEVFTFFYYYCFDHLTAEQKVKMEMEVEVEIIPLRPAA